ncbi:MAG TPA: molybdenum cofactor biosynthesis protein MoaE [Flavisolibacter sp.]|nr:molybdenum cofactor biosynthesis protein MoaE [Flavisolibacter sp.]
MIDIQICSKPLQLDKCLLWVMAPQSGGIDIFIGTVRSKTKDKEVVRLEFEAYESMALKEMHKIAEHCMRQWPVQRMSVHHRVGTLQVGEIPVIIAVSAAHRDAAFDACRYMIDTLKQTVPIWKKEVFLDGEVWVAAHP